MTTYLIVAILTVLGGYGLMEAWPIITGPDIVISSPTDNASFPGGVVAIRGRASYSAQLSLDGAPILRDQQGNFSSTLTFPHGGSILTLVATDRFGRTIRATRSIFVP